MKKKILVLMMLSCSMLCGCQPHPETPETTEQITEFKVSDKDVFVDTKTNTETEHDTPEAIQQTARVSIAHAYQCDGYVILHCLAESSDYLFYMKNSDIGMALYNAAQSQMLYLNIQYTEMDNGDGHNKQYDKFIKDMENQNVTAYTSIQKKLPTIEGTQTTDAYNFTLYKPESIMVVDVNNQILVDNLTSADQLADYIVTTEASTQTEDGATEEGQEETTTSEETSESETP